MAKRYRATVLEKIMLQVLKPPKLLFIIGVILLIGAIFFDFDLLYWFTKLANFLYVDKTMKILKAIVDVMLPGV